MSTEVKDMEARAKHLMAKNINREASPEEVVEIMGLVEAIAEATDSNYADVRRRLLHSIVWED